MADGQRGGRIIVIGGEKGGTGKTTFATHLAFMRAVSGRKVVLVDSDPQKSASSFCATRLANGIFPEIPCQQLVAAIEGKEAKALQLNLGLIVNTLSKLSDHYEDVIVDTGGRDSPELRAALSIADGVYMPLEPGQYDAWTIPKVDAYMMHAREGIVCKVIANKMPTLGNHANKLHRRLDEAVTSGEFQRIQLCRYWMSNRDYFRLTPEYGVTIFEDLPTGEKTSDIKGVREFFALYCDIYEETPEIWRERANSFWDKSERKPDDGSEPDAGVAA